LCQALSLAISMWYRYKTDLERLDKVAHIRTGTLKCMRTNTSLLFNMVHILLAILNESSFPISYRFLMFP
jgi:hypothetical protein